MFCISKKLLVLREPDDNITKNNFPQIKNIYTQFLLVSHLCEVYFFMFYSFFLANGWNSIHKWIVDTLTFFFKSVEMHF